MSGKISITLQVKDDIKPLINQPTYRLWTVLGLICMVVMLWQPPVLAGIAGILLFILLWCGITIRHILSRMLLLLPFGAGAVIFIPFHTPGLPVFQLFGFMATEEGLWRATVIILKLINANFLLTYLLTVTPLFVLLRSLRSIHVPAIMLELIMLMLRYFFLLKDEAFSMFKAQRSRGMRLKGWVWDKRTYRRFGQMVGVLFIRAYQRSQRIYLAMSARGGFEGGITNVINGEKRASEAEGGNRGLNGAGGEFESKAKSGAEGETEGEIKSGAKSGARNGAKSGDKSGDKSGAKSETRNGARNGAKSGAKSETEDSIPPAVEVCKVTYSYGSIKALNGVSFDIPPGSKVALMGPNGAGKSTLISLLNGLELSQSGEVRLFGETVNQGNGDQLRRRVGVVYQDPDDQIFSMTVWEDVAFGPRNLGLSEEEVEERVEEALNSVSMLEMSQRSPFELSYGQKRRVAIAGVLAMRPEFIILDEPMSFLDPKGRDELQVLLESMHLQGLTIMVATHDVDFAAEWADRVLLLKDGRLLASGTAELLFEDELIERASLHLPRLARPFRLLEGTEEQRPRTVRQAAQMIWRLMTKTAGSVALAKTASEQRKLDEAKTGDR